MNANRSANPCDAPSESFVFTHHSKLVDITDAALNKMAEYLFANDAYGALIVATESGGCAGQKYGMSVVLKNDYEKKIDRHALCSIRCAGEERFVATLNDSVLYIAGMRIDYVENETGGGFLFSNPNAVNTCGCGESFSVAKEDE